MSQPCPALLISAAVALVVHFSPARGATFFVSAGGDDEGTGTARAPFATIRRAQRAVRELKGGVGLTAPVTVTIRAGTYELSEPLVFTPLDSGTAECPVTYRAANGDVVVISGGRRLSGFTSTGKLWTTVFPEVRTGTWTFVGPLL